MPIRIPRREPAPQMVFPQASKERSQVTSIGITVLGSLKHTFCPREEKVSAFTPNDPEEGS